MQTAEPRIANPRPAANDAGENDDESENHEQDKQPVDDQQAIRSPLIPARHWSASLRARQGRGDQRAFLAGIEFADGIFALLGSTSIRRRLLINQLNRTAAAGVPRAPPRIVAFDTSRQVVADTRIQRVVCAAQDIDAPLFLRRFSPCFRFIADDWLP
jgi:hypothetical protein